MMNGEVLKISLKNQQKMWEKCPVCGEKPQELDWGDGYLFVKCQTCAENPDLKEKVSCAVSYLSEENNIVKALGQVRDSWNRMCRDHKKETEKLLTEK